MAILLNLILVALAGLIAYWWANQGFFSALIHFMCVVAAGAISFALWEPITVNLLLSGGFFDEYAWGTSLLGVFAIALFLLRLAFDKLVPDNLNLPAWANYTFGGVFGAGAGVLTVGMLMIGAGFMQSSSAIMDFRGWARGSDGQPSLTGQIYPPMHTMTAEFYSAMSNGAMKPLFSRTSLRSVYPELDAYAVSLHRDSFADGQGKTSISPDAVTIDEFMKCDEAPARKGGPRGVFSALINFNRESYDRGEMLVLSAAQARLIGTNRDGKVIAVHPVSWTQMVKRDDADIKVEDHIFDDTTHFASSISGQETAAFLVHFPLGELTGGRPEYIQIKGLRFRLPQPTEELALADWMMKKASLGGENSAVEGKAFVKTAPFIEDGDIRIDSGISPLNLSKNMVSGMVLSGDELAAGRAEFPKDSPFSANRGLRVKGIVEPNGTKVVKVNISRGGSSIDLFNDKHDFRKQAGESATPALVDANGKMYRPIGYFWIKPDKIEIKLDPDKGIKTVSELPALPAAGTHELYLIYRITIGAELKRFTLVTKPKKDEDGFPIGITAGNCDVKVGTPSRGGGFGGLNVGK